MLSSSALTGLDHVVITVESLDAAAAEWARLGFTVAPRGEHSAVMGTSNHTVMFQNDYLELLAVREPTPANQDWREMQAATGEGLHGVALGSASADATHAALNAGGIAAKPVIDFERPVARTGGPDMLAKFRVTSCPKGTITGLKLFVCEHLTREAVWLPELTQHANDVLAITGLDMAVIDAEASAAEWAKVVGPEAVSVGQGAAIVMLGRHRLMLVSELWGKPRVTALRFKVGDIGRTRAALADCGRLVLPNEDGLHVAAVNGVDLIFAM